VTRSDSHTPVVTRIVALNARSCSHLVTLAQGVSALTPFRSGRWPATAGTKRSRRISPTWTRSVSPVASLQGSRTRAGFPACRRRNCGMARPGGGVVVRTRDAGSDCPRPVREQSDVGPGEVPALRERSVGTGAGSAWRTPYPDCRAHADRLSCTDGRHLATGGRPWTATRRRREDLCA
jgi:hypothetical protein